MTHNIVDREQSSRQYPALHEAKRLIEKGDRSHDEFLDIMKEQLEADGLEDLERKMPQLFKDLPIYDSLEASARDVYEAIEYMAEIHNG